MHAFGAACHYHGKKIQNVIAELMREYAEKVLGKGCCPAPNPLRGLVVS